MIISKITSGLGNQLFQYAAAKSLAVKNNTSLYLDLRYYNHQYATDTVRTCKLDYFNVDYKQFESSKPLVLLSKSTKLFPGRTCKPFFELVNEQYHHFNKDVPGKKSKFIYLKGFWQSEKYFSSIADLIRKDFSFKENNKPDFIRYRNAILNSKNPISVHIRRGDYVHHPKFSKTFGFIGLDYYLKAIEVVKAKFSSYRFFVFSDDKEWVINHFPLAADDVIVNTTGTDTDIDDLQLMSLCNHQVIANSSFSWWGAWLNAKPDKTVICPARFYKNQPDWDTKDLIPDGWIKL
ncbi:MAG: alpha-1,2-fucosyltransferase [Sphingobacteriaceae bacterium]|nr:MAG: alpha-1,2-fucosyltransferase [Sphingobacteriaceae bacterium]